MSTDAHVVAKLNEILDDIEAAANRGLDWQEMNHEEYDTIKTLVEAARQYTQPQFEIKDTRPWAGHEHTWTKVSQSQTGMTVTRTYECLVCNTHTTLIGPYGASSPFDVEVNDDSTQASS